MGLEPTAFEVQVRCATNCTNQAILFKNNGMERVGFEPTKHIAIDLQSIPFDRSGTFPN